MVEWRDRLAVALILAAAVVYLVRRVVRWASSMSKGGGACDAGCGCGEDDPAPRA